MVHILITGTTGRVGSSILDFLPSHCQVRVGLRSSKKDKAAWDAYEQVYFDLEKPDTYAAALEGVEKVFLMWPPVKVDYVYAFIRMAEAAGVKHIVFLSIIVAGNLDFLPHRRIEKQLEASKMHFTFLRASYFMQNLDSIHRADIQERNEVFIPAGAGVLNLVDVRDVAEVAAKALTESGHEDKIYALAGRENLNFQEIAQNLSVALEREIRYSNPNILQFVQWMWQKRGYPLSLVLFMLVEYSLARFKLGTDIASEIPKILGKAPRSFAEYAKDYRLAWS